MAAAAGASRSGRRGDDIETEASITFEQAVEGATLPLRMTSDEACTTCHGTGAKPGTVPKVCDKCQGSGMVTGTSGGVFAMTEPCDKCRGRGMAVEHPCPTCQGSGRAPSSRTLQVRVPAGVKDGQRIRLKGKGGRGEGGAPDGDLYLVVHVANHPVFGRKGEQPDGHRPGCLRRGRARCRDPGADARRPAGQDPHPGRHPERSDAARSRARARPRKAGGRGDLLVTIDVQVPKELDGDAKAAVEALRAARDGARPASETVRGGEANDGITVHRTRT